MPLRYPAKPDGEHNVVAWFQGTTWSEAEQRFIPEVIALGHACETCIESGTPRPQEACYGIARRWYCTDHWIARCIAQRAS